MSGVSSLFSCGTQSSVGSSAFIVNSSQACPGPSTSSFFPSWSDRATQSSPFHLPLPIAFPRLLITTLTMNLFDHFRAPALGRVLRKCLKSQWTLAYPILLCICWSNSLKIQSWGTYLALSNIYYLLHVFPIIFSLPYQAQYNSILVVLGFNPITVLAIRRADSTWAEHLLLCKKKPLYHLLVEEKY